MVYFDSQNGWIQLAFANKEDTYYLPGMMCVNFERYLFYCLKKDGYEAVFFWNEANKRPEVSYMDLDSGCYYEKIRPQSLWKKLLGNNDVLSETESYKWTTVRLSGDSMMEQIFYQIADGKKKTALVVPVSVFDTFFSDRIRAEVLIDRSKRQKSQRNLVLIVASSRAEDSNRYLTKKDGILPRLFEEIRQAATADTGMDLYEMIQVNMGDRCRYLNDLNPQLIGSMIRAKAVQDEKDDLHIAWNLLEQITDVVVWYYHSEMFRKAVPITLPRNPKREIKVIAESLKNPKNWMVIQRWIEEKMGEASAHDFYSWLQLHFPLDREISCIYTDSFLLKQWEQIVPCENSSPAQQQEWEIQLRDIRRRLRVLILRGGTQHCAQQMESCTMQVGKSRTSGDIETFRYGLNAMQYLLSTREDQEDSIRKVWQFYGKIFELSEEIRKLRQMNISDKKHITEMKTEMRSLFERISVMEHQPADEEDGGELDVMRQRALQCDADIGLINSVVTVRNNQCFQYQQAIASLEQAIQSEAGGSMVDVQGVLRKAMETQQNALKQNYETIKAVSEVAKRPSELKRITGQDMEVSEDLEKRYRALEERMNKLT